MNKPRIHDTCDTGR